MECPIVTQAAYEASPDQMAVDPVTTSPYRVTSYQTGSKITMEYTGAYWQTDESLVRTTSGITSTRSPSPSFRIPCS